MPRDGTGDVIATAKRDLKAGEALDGEGGYTVYGRLLPSRASLEKRGLPIGLAQGVTLKQPVAAGETLTWPHVGIEHETEALKFRREMESRYRSELGIA